MAATFNDRIVDLIGDYAAKINDSHEQDILNTAISTVADSVETELLLKYAKTPIVLNNSSTTWNAVEGKKVLLVTRKDADSNPVDRECKIVGISDFSQAGDSDSLYKATEYSPVACYTTTGGQASLEVLPLPTSSQTASIYYFEYPTSNLKEANDTALNAAGIPDQLFHVIALKTSLAMLLAYVSDAVQDEEDTEIVTMLQAQIANLGQQYDLEIAKFVEGRPE